jgi:intracellular multiplication protein IcmB
MNVLQKILAPFQKAFRQSVSSFIQLETADDEITLVSTDGSLVTYLKVEGSRQIIGEEEFKKIVEGATIKVGSRFDRQGHAMQVYFARDPNRIREELEELMRPSRISANNIGIDLDDLFEERLRHLQRFCTHEESYFVLWTTAERPDQNRIPKILERSQAESQRLDQRALRAISECRA